jgi:hypothetical protein
VPGLGDVALDLGGEPLLPGLGGDPVDAYTGQRGGGCVSRAQRLGDDPLGGQADGLGAPPERACDGTAGEPIAALSAGDRPQTHPAIAVVHVSILLNRHHGSRRISAPMRLHDVFRLHIWLHKANSKRPSPNGKGPLTCDDAGSGGRI